MFGRGQKQGHCDVSQQETAQCDITTLSKKNKEQAGLVFLLPGLLMVKLKTHLVI